MSNLNRQNKKDHAQQKEKNSRTVCVVTVFYKGQCFGSLVFDSPETGLSITSALRTMLGPLNEQDISFETALHPLYDTAAIEGELQNAIKSLVPSAPPSPVVDLGKLLTEERALNGLSVRLRAQGVGRACFPVAGERPNPIPRGRNDGGVRSGIRYRQQPLPLRPGAQDVNMGEVRALHCRPFAFAHGSRYP